MAKRSGQVGEVSGAALAAGPPKEKPEVPAPKPVLCPHCGWDVARVQYTKVYREQGVRHVHLECMKCGGYFYFEDKLK